ncbi:hypothetical protein [Ponticaulis profundi]|uniref:Spore coat protein U domain-containing protein n=1 Tax=Ponticaulis profundi TaxID=2665222 RepID=A0ABW1SE01_9PROT
MKRVLLAAVAASFLAAPAIAASSDSTTITLDGSVADTCLIGTAATSSLTNVTPTTETDLDITALADAGTALIQDAAATVTFANSYCNYAHSFGFQAANGALAYDSSVTVTPSSGTFLQQVGYTATLDWSELASPLSISSTNDTSASASGSAVNDTTTATGAFRGDLVFTVDLDETTSASIPLLSGGYSETFTLSLGATL